MTASLRVFVRQVWCGVRKHDHLLTLERHRMFLKCATCARETPGWDLTEPRPTGPLQKILRLSRRVAS